MGTRLLKISATAILVLLLAPVAFASAPQEPARLDIPVGLLLSLSGDIGDDGIKMKDGAIMRAEEINSLPPSGPGGVDIGGNKYLIRLITEDDASVPQTAIAATNKLLTTDKVQVVIGSDGSTLCGAIDSLLSQYQVPAISPSCTAADLAEKEWFFRTVGSDALQSEGMFDLVEKLREHDWFGKKVALLSVNNAYGIGMHNAMKSLLTAAGYTVVSDITFEEGKSTYETEVQAIRDAKGRSAPNENLAVLFTAYPKHALPIMRDVQKLGVVPSNGFVWVSNDGIVNSDSLVDDPTAQIALQGLFGTNPTAPPTSSVYQDFKQKFRLKFGYQPSSYAAFAYDALGVAVKAIETAGAYDGAKIRTALAAMTGAAAYSGVTGPKEFDAKGDVKSQFYDIYRVTGRDWHSTGAWWIDPAKGVENFDTDPQPGELPYYPPTGNTTPPPQTNSPVLLVLGVVGAALVIIVVVAIILMGRKPKPGPAHVPAAADRPTASAPPPAPPPPTSSPPASPSSPPPPP